MKKKIKNQNLNLSETNKRLHDTNDDLRANIEVYKSRLFRVNDVNYNSDITSWIFICC